MRTHLGQYELVRRIAVGGSSEIYLAQPPGARPHVVLKVLLEHHAADEERRKVFIDEGRLTAQLSHPNIVKLHDIAQADGRIFMVLDYVDGTDAAKLLAAATSLRQQMPFEFVAYVAHEVCAGLHFAHTRVGSDGRPLHFIHRDVSPSNIMVGSGGEVRLIDFGIAKAEGGGRLDTKTGVIKGQLTYMAPEYAAGNDQSPRADIFAVGLCIYELLTGRPAYADPNPVRQIERIKTASIDPIRSLRPDIPPLFEATLNRALAADPARRFESADQMRSQLGQIVQALVPAGYGQGNAGQYVRAIRRHTEQAAPAVAGHNPATRPTVPNTGQGGGDATSPLSAGALQTARAAAGAVFDDDDDDLETMNLDPSAIPAHMLPGGLGAPEDDEPTADELDVSIIRGSTFDKRPDIASRHASRSPNIFTQSGFQKSLSSSEVDRIRSGGAQKPPGTGIDTTGPMKIGGRTYDASATPAGPIGRPDDRTEHMSQGGLTFDPTGPMPAGSPLAFEDDDGPPTIVPTQARTVRGDDGPATLPPDFEAGEATMMHDPHESMPTIPPGSMNLSDPGAPTLPPVDPNSGRPTMPSALPVDALGGVPSAQPVTPASLQSPSGLQPIPAGAGDLTGPGPQLKAPNFSGNPSGSYAAQLHTDERMPMKRPGYMEDAAHKLADRAGGTFGRFAKTEKGRRAIDAGVVVLLGLVFLSLILYTFFFAD